MGNLSLATGKSYVNTSLKVNFPKTKKFVLAGDSLAVFMAYEKSSAVFVFNNRTNEISDTLNIGNNENIEYFGEYFKIKDGQVIKDPTTTIRY